MPIFAYRCESCGHRLDELQKLTDEPLKDCPACGEPSLQKLLSAPNFHLKGGGWRGSEEPKPKKRPKYMHTFDSPVPHGDHVDNGHDHGHSHDHGHDQGHKHDHGKGHDHKD